MPSCRLCTSEAGCVVGNQCLMHRLPQSKAVCMPLLSKHFFPSGERLCPCSGDHVFKHLQHRRLHLCGRINERGGRCTIASAKRAIELVQKAPRIVDRAQVYDFDLGNTYYGEGLERFVDISSALAHLLHHPTYALLTMWRPTTIWLPAHLDIRLQDYLASISAEFGSRIFLF